MRSSRRSRTIRTTARVCLSRIYGLGGRDFYVEDAEALFRLAIEAAGGGPTPPLFDYYGVVPGDPERPPRRPGLPPLSREEMSGLVDVKVDAQTGRLRVEAPPAWRLVARPKRVAPGHGACPGCGVFPALDQFLRGIEGDIVVLYQTGCAMVVSTGYPYTSHRVTYVHNLFQNGAATLGGLVEMFKERQRRGELPSGEDITFVMVTGDGGMDIGTGAAIGAALRNHRLIIVEYDNQGYMNTGAQLSYSTPLGHRTSTSHVGPGEHGKSFHHKDMPQIMAATNIPYVFTGVEGFPDDLLAKGAKAQWYAQQRGDGLRQAAHLLPAQLADGRQRGRRHRPGSGRLLLLPALRDRAAHDVAHLRPRAARPPDSGRRVARDDGQDEAPLPARVRVRAHRDRGGGGAPLAAAQGDERAPAPLGGVMAIVLEKRELTPVTTLFVVDAPLIAHHAQPGQFVILRVDAHGERVPISLTDFDRGLGTITLVVQEVGKTTRLICALEEGDDVLDLVGPLGRPAPLPAEGHAVLVGGGFGAGALYPLARELAARGVRVSSIVGARTADLVILRDLLEGVSDAYYVCTDDGSCGYHGFNASLLSEQLERNADYTDCIAIGPVAMMRAVAEVTRPCRLHTLVSLDPIMVDGTGMCGACRISVGGETKFACVDGPFFDAHEVDFDEAVVRSKMYVEEERLADELVKAR